MKVNFKIKVLLNMLFIALLLLAMSILAYFTQQQIAQKADEIEKSATYLGEVSHLKLLVSQITMPANDYLLTGDAGEKNNFGKLVSQLDEQINKVKGIRLKDDARKEVGKIEPQLMQIKSKSEAIFSIQDPISDRRGIIIMAEMDAYAKTVLDKADVIYTIIRQDMENARNAYIRIQNRNRIFLLTFAAIGLLLALYAGVNTNRMADKIQELMTADRKAKESLEETVNQYAQFVGGIAEGNLTAKLAIAPGNNGVLGQLGNDLNSMVEGLCHITSQVKEASIDITSATSEIATAISQQSASASEQSAAVNQTVSTVDEIKQTTQAVTARANTVVEIAQRSVEVSKRGQEAVEDTIGGVNSIKEQVKNIGDGIISLNEKTLAISGIIDAVNDIAEQSKMLAFNAAIEASKAGEAGKGFSVVASEIRNLAERSQEETANVRAILEDIQKATNSAVMIAEKGSKEADEGVKLASLAGKNIDQLAETIVEAANSMEQITMSIEQQNMAIEQISQAMSNIELATTETAAGTAQAAKATQDLNQLATKMTELVEQYALS